MSVRVTRLATDPLCMRTSIGGTPELGYYLVWRGDDPQAVLAMLREALVQAELQLQIPRAPMSDAVAMHTGLADLGPGPGREG